MTEPRNFIVYIHTSPTGKSYIGITSKYDKRCQQHRSAARRGVGCRAFGNALRRYGWDAFTHGILQDNLTADEAKAAETKFIAQYDTLAPNGYNLTTGGEHARASDETRAIITANSLARPPATQETRAKISAAQSGVPKSPEHVEKVRAALYDDQDKAKARAAKAGRTRTGKKYDTSGGGAVAMWAGRSAEDVAAITEKRLASLDRAAQAEKAAAYHARLTDEQKAQRAANIRAALADRRQTPEQKAAAHQRRLALQRIRRAAKRSAPIIT